MQVLEEGSVKTYFGQGGRSIRHDEYASEEDDKKARALILTILNDEAALDSYFKKNPLNLYYLDKHPDIKAGVIKRTGIRDLSRLGKNLDTKWI